jgi:hypothetical protein
VEHAVYVCGWSKSKEGFTLVVKSRPEWRATGPTYEEAEELLLDRIRDGGGAMQAVLDFVPPLPPSERDQRYLVPELFLLAGDDIGQAADIPGPFEERVEAADRFYRAPLCRACRSATATRSEEPLVLEGPVRGDGAFVSVAGLGGLTVRLFSERFVDLLSAEERGRLLLRPVLRKGRGGSHVRSRFLELTGPGGAPEVALRGRPLAGWRCATCRQARWGYGRGVTDVFLFVAAEDLPSPLPAVFTVGASSRVELVVTAERWAEMAGRQGARGLVAHRVGVVREVDVDRQPTLPPYLV